MAKKLRLILIIVLLIIFVISTTLLILQLVDNKRNKDIYNDALDIALGNAEAEEAIDVKIWIPEPVEDDEYYKEMMDINLDALRKRNEDVVGWIRIPNTLLDYPIMQGEDNEYYLNHAWNNDDSFSGSIFLESRCNPSFTEYNTIIYGHNMRNGSMFATLREYKKEKYLKKKPYVYIRTDEGVFRYEIFAAFDAPLDSPVYGLSFNQNETKVKFLKFSAENTVIESGVEPELTDRILTLSTCTNTGYSTRWVVQARLKMIEVSLKDIAETTTDMN